MVKIKNLVLLSLIIAFGAFLRLWAIDKVPVSLFGDELDVGYQAYSILQTGRDYSGNFLPLHFQSLAEWRTPLYLYSVVPTVSLFGISPFGVRLPAVMFGIIGIFFFYLLICHITKNKTLALLCALLLAISPWHIQYSRAGFEATEMLAVYLAGIYFFLLGIKNGKWLILSAVCLALTPWVYSTAKLFLPLTLVALLVIWYQEIPKINVKYLTASVVVFLIVILPIFYSTLFGGGLQRFNYLSILHDSRMGYQVGLQRKRDFEMDVNGAKFFHNRFVWWMNVFLNNYLQAFSPQFLFIDGDSNLRHSLNGMGEFYKIEFLFMLVGIGVFFSTKLLDKKTKLFFVFWLLASPVPAALTRDGGMHATRLFFLLPPLIFLIAFGVWWILQIGTKVRVYTAVVIVLAYAISFFFYQHNYWVHYPWDSERWWHAGWKEAVQAIKKVDKDYDKVFISMASDPAWIFFLSWYQYPPDRLHQIWLPGRKLPTEDIDGFGKVSKIDKFYFGTAKVQDMYSLWTVLPDNALYLAPSDEVKVNLIKEPERTPRDLRLIKSIAYPSGKPAFYLFTKK